MIEVLRYLQHNTMSGRVLRKKLAEIGHPMSVIKFYIFMEKLSERVELYYVDCVIDDDKIKIPYFRLKS